MVASIPKDGEKLPILDVEYEHDTADHWNERMFRGKGKITADRDQLLTIEGIHAKLKITDNRRIIYTADHTSNRSLEKKKRSKWRSASSKSGNFPLGICNWLRRIRREFAGD